MVKQYQLRGHSGPVTGQVVKLDEHEITLGRDLANDVVISDGEVSRIHARIGPQGERHLVVDLRSTNGTWINGRPVLGAVELKVGDLLTLGKTSVFVYEPVPESELDTTRGIDGDGDGVNDLITSTMALPITPRAAVAARQVSGGPPTPSATPEQAAGVEAARDAGPPALVLDSERDAAIAPPDDTEFPTGHPHDDTEAPSGRADDTESPTDHPISDTGEPTGQPAPLTVEPGQGRVLHERYLAALRSADVEGLLTLYHADATLLTGDRGANGMDELREYFRDLATRWSPTGDALRTRATGRYVEGRDCILCEAEWQTADVAARVQDVFVFRDGKVTHHISSVLELRPA